MVYIVKLVPKYVHTYLWLTLFKAKYVDTCKFKMEFSSIIICVCICVVTLEWNLPSLLRATRRNLPPLNGVCGLLR